MILLSHIIDSQTPSYGDRDKFIIEESSRIIQGASANSSKWTFSTNHIGTHIDMPRHFFDEGQTLTDVPIDFWFSEKVQLIDVPCTKAKLIEINDLKSDINSLTEVLLIRTNYEKFRKTDKYWNDNPGLSPNLGRWIRKNRPAIKIVGFDFISLTSWKNRAVGKESHRAFLDPTTEGQAICIVEDMKLSVVKTNINKLIIAPLFVLDGDGGMVTVFAI
jgi:arylformamidase